MKHKFILSLMAVSMMLLGTQPLTVHAAQIQEEIIQTEQVSGDGYEIVEHYDTVRSLETSGVLNVTTLCPEGFGLNTYVMLMDEAGNTYRISLSAENDYWGQIYLAPGDYQVTEVSVFHDYKQEYPFVITERYITLAENENKTLIFAMKEYEQLKQEIVEKTSEKLMAKDNQEIVFSDAQFYDTGLDGVTMQGTGILFYEVEHLGTSKGTMEVCGHATGDYEIVVKIVKTGVLGEAVFQISLDGGNSFVGQDIVSESSRIGDAGVTLYFKTEQDTVEFMQGDEYHVSVPETFTVVASKAGAANLIVTGHPLEEHDFTVTVLSSGGLGKSRFTVESTKGPAIRVTDVVPESGIYELEDDITLVFSDSTAYERGLVFTVTIESNDKTFDYTPVYVLLGIAVSGAAAAFSIMGSRREKDSEYRIRQYKWQKEEQEYDR